MYIYMIDYKIVIILQSMAFSVAKRFIIYNLYQKNTKGTSKH